MSDTPTLYIANPSPIEGEAEAIERLVAFRAIVPVEPFDIWHQYDERDRTMPCRLPKGKYAIVRLDDE